MASHVVVIDSTFRRAIVKTEPGTYISDILEKGCEKLGLKAERYVLKHNKKPIDMTRTFRQTGLSSGAKLELVQGSKSAAPVSVALQLPDSLAEGIPNRRLTGTFSSATTFWLLLRKFESDEGKNLNITGRGVAQTQQGMTGAGRIFYEQPVCQVMGRELSNITDLQKSLSSLGFSSGSCLIRLSFRVTGTPLEEAMAEITQYFKSVEPKSEKQTEEAALPSSIAQPTDDVKNVPQKSVDSIQKAETSIPTDLDSPMPDASSQPSEEVPSTATQQPPPTTTTTTTTTQEPAPPASIPDKILGPGGREISVFSAPTDAIPRAALHPHNESDFEATLAHVRLHESRIKGESRNKRLPTDAEAQKIAEEKAAKKALIKSVEIKVRFPDQTATSTKFTNEDDAKELYDFVRGVLREEIQDEGFTLNYHDDKGVKVLPKDGKEKLIVDLGFVGRILINFNWEPNVVGAARTGPVLQAKYVEKAQGIPVPDIPVVVEEDEKDTVGEGKVKGVMGGIGGGSGEAKEKKVPKWLKGAFGKK